MMLSNGLHDELWIKGAEALPKIESALRYQNMIACINALYEAGEMTKEAYCVSIIEMAKKSGFEFIESK